MAMPVVKGVKSDSERFAGAEDTYTIEALMQDGKALQAGTSHFLGQNFAKAFDVKFTTKEGKQEHVWATSWGVSTRLIGGLIMTHSDDFGLVLPPKLAPIQVVIIPIYKGEEQLEAISEKVNVLVKELRSKGISVKFDNRDTYRPGAKFAEYELKGVPVRIAMGNRDLESGTLEVARRDTLEKQTIAQEDAVAFIESLLEKVDHLIIGGGMVYTFTKALGGQVGNSICEPDYCDYALELLEKAKTKGVEIHLPVDVLAGDDFSNDATQKTFDVMNIPDGWEAMDAGPESQVLFHNLILKCKTILWNGPMGVFEFSNFSKGTIAAGDSIAEATQAGAFSLVGGGDSVAAVKQFGFENKMSYISTGGGAMLESLEGKILPGIAALNE